MSGSRSIPESGSLLTDWFALPTFCTKNLTAKLYQSNSPPAIIGSISNAQVSRIVGNSKHGLDHIANPKIKPIKIYLTTEMKKK